MNQVNTNKLSAQAYHKKKSQEHTWVCTYVDSLSNKQVKFTCSNAMKKSHEMLMQGNQHVKDVCFVKGVV
jgi:hypothetical protein